MKACKLIDCVALSNGTVNCLALGRKSGRVMASGGDDRCVKLWAVGKPACILTLKGHTSSVECVAFNADEDLVAAGSLSGSVRIWDPEEVKTIRALSGHTSTVTSIDFHPFGNFIASGSLDSTVKLWDISRKGCINTYRGHSQGGVTTVQFSPDGKWLVSTGCDGSVKLWDLSTGHLLADLSAYHSGPVSSAAFHPTVLLLATATSSPVDQSTRLFDLETFTQVAATTPTALVNGGTGQAAPVIGPSRRLAFHPDGSCLYASASDNLKIFDFESMTCLETVHVGWARSSNNGLADMSITADSSQLIGVSAASNQLISTFIVNVKLCQPFTVADYPTNCAPTRPTLIGDHQSASESTQQSASTTTSVGNNITSRSGLVANARLPPPPPPSVNSSSSTAINGKNRKSFCLSHDSGSEPAASLKEDAINNVDDADDLHTIGGDINDLGEYDRVFRPRQSALKRSPPRSPIVPSGQPTTEPATTRHRQSVTRRSPPASNEMVGHSQSQAMSADSQSGRRPSATKVPGGLNNGDTVVSELDALLLRASASSTTSINGTAATGKTDDQSLLASLRRPHSLVLQTLTSRIDHLTRLRLIWSSSSTTRTPGLPNVNGCLEAALQLPGDDNQPESTAVLVDLFGFMVTNSKLWNLDLAHRLLPKLSQLFMESKHVSHVSIACQGLRLVLKNFGQQIRQTAVNPHPPGVDLMRDERKRKCEESLVVLSTVSDCLDRPDLVKRAGQQSIRELRLLFHTIESSSPMASMNTSVNR